MTAINRTSFDIETYKDVKDLNQNSDIFYDINNISNRSSKMDNTMFESCILIKNNFENATEIVDDSIPFNNNVSFGENVSKDIKIKSTKDKDKDRKDYLNDVDLVTGNECNVSMNNSRFFNEDDEQQKGGNTEILS